MTVWLAFAIGVVVGGVAVFLFFLMDKNVVVMKSSGEEAVTTPGGGTDRGEARAMHRHDKRSFLDEFEYGD